MKGDKTAAVGEVTVRLSTTVLKVPLAIVIIVMIAFTILIAPDWLTDILSGAETSFAQLVSFPLFLAVMFISILLVTCAQREVGKADIYGGTGIESKGVRYPWERVSCLYVNHNMNHMILLFRGLTGPAGRAGFIIPKLGIEPSFEALIKLAESKGVRIEHKEQISVRDFMLVSSGWHQGVPVRAPSEVLKEQERQTFGYMATHWPEAGILLLCSSAVAVLFTYVIFTIAFLSLASMGRADSGFTLQFIVLSIATPALGISAVLAFRYWRKWSGIPPPREPPTV